MICIGMAFLKNHLALPVIFSDWQCASKPPFLGFSHLLTSSHPKVGVHFWVTTTHDELKANCPPAHAPEANDDLYRGGVPKKSSGSASYFF